MGSAASPNVTGLLKAWSEGSPQALAELMPLVYGELHKVARAYMRRQQPGKTLQATALANEAYLKLVGAQGVGWKDRAHFFAVAAQMMRRILVDATRARCAAKRQAGGLRVTFSDQLKVPGGEDENLLALDDALSALAKHDARKARVVELRYFGGLSVEETAAVLKISEQSILRDWKLAKSWLARELSRSGRNES
jgi:RNA polymerase sigma factor (TIGR02999 family)